MRHRLARRLASGLERVTASLEDVFVAATGFRGLDGRRRDEARAA